MTEGDLPQKRIVVADDNSDTLATLRLLLESMGHKVHVAHDGAAIEAVEKFEP